MKKTTFFLFLILAISAISAYAADIYLDKNATSCSNGSTNYDPATRSCGSGSSKIYITPYACSKALVNGDHVYIRAGEYYENVRGTAEWTGGGCNPSCGARGNTGIGTFSLRWPITNITVENYNGELVWLMSGPDHSDISGNDTNYPIIVDGTFNTVKGNSGNFKIWGMVAMGGNNNAVDGLDISGGGIQPITTDCWSNLVFHFGSNNTLRNSQLHDNKWCGSYDSGNNSMIMHEGDSNTLNENNHFYNPYGAWIFPKYQASGVGTVQTTYRYNFFEGCTSGRVFLGAAKFYGAEIRVYQNIFKNATQSGGDMFESAGAMNSQKFVIYNNTFYNVATALKAWTTSDAHNYFNNIIYTDSMATKGIFYDFINFTGSYSNYNDFYATGSGSMSWTQYTSTWSTISGWRTATGQDANSVTTNPNFINASGLFNTPTDFKRASYPATGRGGSWPSVMGAYITGNEVIGVSGGTQPPPPAKTPNPPTTLMVN